MDRLIWTAVSGMNASMARERMIANNMANSQTPGFRAEVMAATPVTLHGPSLQVRALTDAAVYGAQMDPGALVETGRPLDLAVGGDALLSVQAADGSEAYTRRGDLSVSPSGLLVNGEGYAVIGETGPISVPPGSDVTIGKDGAVLVRNLSDPAAPAQQVDKIKLASWRGSRIEKGLDGLFRVFGGGALPADAAAHVITSSLEQSNVKPAQVLVDPVEISRAENWSLASPP